MAGDDEFQVDVLEILQDGLRPILEQADPKSKNAYDAGATAFLTAVEKLKPTQLGTIQVHEILENVRQRLGVKGDVEDTTQQLAAREAGVRAAEAFCLGYVEGLGHGFEVASELASRVPGVSSSTRRA